MTWAERMAEVHRLAQAAIIDDEFIRAFEEGYDSAERRKQALKERIRQMDVERRARYKLSR
jgi:tRNA A-37 threonylcarbamoyl transferase component Bud32